MRKPSAIPRTIDLARIPPKFVAENARDIEHAVPRGAAAHVRRARSARSGLTAAAIHP